MVVLWAGFLIAGSGIVLVALIILHLLPTGLRPWRDPVSQYGITRFRALYWIAAYGAALAGVGGALTLDHLVGQATAGSILLWVFAAARALIPFFAMDAPGAMRTSRGRIHNLLAIIAFAAVTAAAFVAAGALHDAGHASLATLTTLLAVVMAIGSIGVLLALFTRLRRVFGISERLIYLGFIAWFLALGIGVLLPR